MFSQVVSEACPHLTQQGKGTWEGRFAHEAVFRVLFLLLMSFYPGKIDAEKGGHLRGKDAMGIGSLLGQGAGGWGRGWWWVGGWLGILITFSWLS